jgi:hypothetical protein
MKDPVRTTTGPAGSTAGGALLGARLGGAAAALGVATTVDSVSLTVVSVNNRQGWNQ